MRMIYQITVCICMIILAGGTVHYIHDNPSFGGGVLLIMVWGCLIGIIGVLASETAVFDFGSRKKTKEDPHASDRMTHLEKRLSDIQDIVITIDEKLSRSEKQSGIKQIEDEKVS